MCSTKVVEKALRAGEKLFLCVATTTKNSETKLKIGETYFRPVLQEFADVLAEELHQIELIPGSMPPSKAPYQMDHAQLQELKRTIGEATRKGFHIRPSKSPYGAPFIFVKKKDGPMHLCVHYCSMSDR